MSSSSSFRARLESLPLRYSAPAGGYAPMPSPDDAPGIGDRGEETGPRIKVGPDGYGVVVTTADGRQLAFAVMANGFPANGGGAAAAAIDNHFVAPLASCGCS